MVSDAARALIRPTVQACRHDKTRQRRIRICARCRMRRERLIRPTLPSPADLIQRRRIINGRQIPRIASSQIAWIVRRSIFPDRVFGNARQTRRAPGGQSCQSGCPPAHNRLLLRVRHLTVFQTVALFGMTNATATCPFSASFTPTTPLRQRPDDWRYSLQSHAYPAMSGNVNHIVSAPENKVITVTSRMPQSKVAYTGRENSDQYSSQSGRRRPRWSEYSLAAMALHHQHPFLIDATRFAGDFIGNCTL